jgi:hypothetical protein
VIPPEIGVKVCVKCQPTGFEEHCHYCNAPIDSETKMYTGKRRKP